MYPFAIEELTWAMERDKQEERRHIRDDVRRPDDAGHCGLLGQLAHGLRNLFSQGSGA